MHSPTNPQPPRALPAYAQPKSGFVMRAARSHGLPCVVIPIDTSDTLSPMERAAMVREMASHGAMIRLHSACRAHTYGTTPLATPSAARIRLASLTAKRARPMTARQCVARVCLVALGFAAWVAVFVFAAS